MQLDVFQTLADPTRRRIVEVLRHGEQQVDERHRAATLFGQRFEHAHESLWARNRQVGRLRDLRW